MGRIFLSAPTFIGILISAFPHASLTINGQEFATTPALLLLAIVCGIVGGVGVVKKRQSLIALELENEDLRRFASDYANDTKLLLEDMLRDLAVDCELADEKGMMQGDVRMTVYWYDHSSPHFVPVVRVSGHPDFSEYGRSAIAVGEGVISEGWSLSYSRFKSEANDDAEWVAEQVSDYKIDKEIAGKIRMKSRSILAWRLQYDHVHFGVFVVESMRKTKANSALKTKIENSRQFEPIKRAVYRVRQSHIRRSLSPDH